MPVCSPWRKKCSMSKSEKTNTHFKTDWLCILFMNGKCSVNAVYFSPHLSSSRLKLSSTSAFSLSFFTPKSKSAVRWPVRQPATLFLLLKKKLKFFFPPKLEFNQLFLHSVVSGFYAFVLLPSPHSVSADQAPNLTGLPVCFEDDCTGSRGGLFQMCCSGGEKINMAWSSNTFCPNALLSVDLNIILLYVQHLSSRHS